MNNKGFTLVEMLAVVVILAIISGIAVNGVVSYINTTKEKSEEIFVDNLSDYIDNYVDIYGNGLSVVNANKYQFDKCRRTKTESDEAKGLYSGYSIGDCVPFTDGGEVLKSTVSVSEVTSFELLNITSADVKLVNSDDLVNPANKLKCFDGVNPSVRLFKDDDYVYYYYVDLKGNNTCELNDKNIVVTNIPKKLCADIKLKDGDDTIRCES